LPNVYLLHFENLKSDLAAEIHRIAEFIETPIDETQLDPILRHCSFDYMKANATKSVPLGGSFWDGGAQTFIHKGTNGRWRKVLSDAEVLKYERRAAEELDSECAVWLATGKIT
jgi:aryl sulfotransferase